MLLPPLQEELLRALEADQRELTDQFPALRATSPRGRRVVLAPPRERRVVLAAARERRVEGGLAAARERRVEEVLSSAILRSGEARRPLSCSGRAQGVQRERR